MPTKTSTATSKPSIFQYKPKYVSPPKYRLENGGLRTQGFDVIDWIEANCVLTNAEWVGQPFRLQPWQKDLILRLFELRPDGRRRYRLAYISVPKKNGKTELVSALLLYLLIGDEEPAPYIPCAAWSERQANLLFGATSTMCKKSETLSQVTEVFDNKILVIGETNAELHRVSSKASTLEGANIHAAGLDEEHEWLGESGRRLRGVIANGTGARKNALILQLTTAGFDRTSICWDQYQRAREAAAGDPHDPDYDETFFAYVWEPDEEDCDISDPEVWRQANPSYGVILEDDYFKEKLKDMPENEFRRFVLNQWTESQTSWLPPGAWSNLAEPGAKLEPGSLVFVGVDMAHNNDSAAVMVAGTREDGRVVVEVKIFDPPPDGTDIDYAAVKNEVKRVCLKYRPKEVLFDKWRFAQTAQELHSEDGLPMVEFPFSNERTAPASQTLYEGIVNGVIVHNGDPVLEAHVKAATRKETERGWRINKAVVGGQPNDACQTLLMVFDRLSAHNFPKASKLKHRGLLSTKRPNAHGQDQNT